MVIATNTWTLDHCGCIISYDFDTTVPQDQRIHIQTTNPNAAALQKKCPAHQSLSNFRTHHDTVLEESGRKENARQHLIDNFPALFSDSGAIGGNLKANLGFSYLYTGTAPNRVVTISFSGITLTQAQKTQAQNRLDTKFGAGKVIIQ